MKKKIITIALLLCIIIIAFLNINICFGRCLNNNGDGKVYNGEPYYNYISYKNTEAQENDIVLTIDILNPMNLAPDDILYRFDFVILKDLNIESDTIKTETNRTIKDIPDGYINTKTEKFYNNYIDMRQVTDYTTTENGLQLYFSDGSGYYWER